MSNWNFKYSYRELPSEFYADIEALEAVAKPEIAVFNNALAKEINLSNSLTAKELCGIDLPQDAKPLAMAYAGHQFGYLTMLGDGRACLLGEHIDQFGQHLDVHLKGSGPTVYSRGGDGRAALAPMLREYIVSEAMATLGVPTTRSLAVLTTGEMVRREELLPGGILVRIARSHVRVGSFVFAAQLGDEHLRALADHTMKRLYPEVEQGDYLGLLRLVVQKQAALICDWMLLGFIHGVMNTDNMSIAGETIDYGPCAFMEQFNEATVFSSIDRGGRYAYANQPIIAQWNLARFAETLLTLIDQNPNSAIDKAKKVLDLFPQIYEELKLKKLRLKLGIKDSQADDQKICAELFDIMRSEKLDFTTTFRSLCDENYCGLIGHSHSAKLNSWRERWHHRLQPDDNTKKQNPAYIPRNHLVEDALQAANLGDLTKVETLFDILQNPYELQPQYTFYLLPANEQQRVTETFCGT